MSNLGKLSNEELASHINVLEDFAFNLQQNGYAYNTARYEKVSASLKRHIAEVALEMKRRRGSWS